MQFLVKSFQEVRVGIALLLLLALVRFSMLPVFGVPYDEGTTYTSLSLLMLVLLVYYLIAAVRRPGTSYRDILGIALAISAAQGVVIAAAILIDDLGGIDTYFTAPGHGGGVNPLAHAGEHLVGIVFATLVFWGIGSLLLAVFRMRPAGSV